MTCLIFFSCARDNVMKDGYYTAEALDFDSYGWKEFVSIYVNSGSIVTVEYNAKNSSGFIKSWDSDYLRTMSRVSGTYPDEYTRSYAEGLLKMQIPDSITAISGATESWSYFKLLANAAMEQAYRGDKQVVFVTFPEQAGSGVHSPSPSGNAP
ncbi:MAG: FMN-binding protein [Treponema sp.]|nr:FMN-binding protein [Treponema sp.]